MKICFLRQTGTNGWRQIQEITQKKNLWNVLQLICCNFLQKNTKVLLLVEGLGTRSKLRKLSKPIISAECFFLRFLTEKCQNLSTETFKLIG